MGNGRNLTIPRGPAKRHPARPVATAPAFVQHVASEQEDPASFHARTLAQGSRIAIETDGTDADEALAALVSLIEDRFGEGE